MTPPTSAAHSRDDESLLGLARELRLLDLHRQHEAHAFPDVLGRELDAARQEIAELAELAQRLGRARSAGRSRACRPAASESGSRSSRARPRRRRAARRSPTRRPRACLRACRRTAAPGASRRRRALLQVLLEAAGVDPALLLLRLLDLERDRRARGTARPSRAARASAAAARTAASRSTSDSGQKRTVVPVLALADLAHDLELAAALAVDEAHVVFLAVAPDPDLEVLRQARSRPTRRRRAGRPRTGSSCSMNLPPACRRVRISSTPGTFSFGMDVDRHAAAVVGHFAASRPRTASRRSSWQWPATASSTLLSMTSCAR